LGTEIVQTGENGYLASLGNIEEMAQRVLQLLGNEEMRLLMGRKSQTMVEPFSAQKMVEDYTRLYLRMMDRPCSRPRG
jgi:glycosyltransferase involved in cell wall biosynthesis